MPGSAANLYLDKTLHHPSNHHYIENTCMKRGPRFPWDLKTQQTKTFIVCKNKDIMRLLFQSRKNVLVVSTFRFHAISMWKRKTIGRASRASTRFCVQRSVSIFGTKCLVFQYLKTAHSDYRIGWRRSKGQDESTWRWLHTKDSERCVWSSLTISTEYQYAIS